MDLSGIFPPITTPFTEDGTAVDCSKLRANLLKWNSLDFRGYVVLGSNGEAHFLSESEKLTVIREARECIPREKLMIVGAGLEGTKCTVDFCEKAAAAGADALLLLTPCYFKSLMTEAALVRHYTKVADDCHVPVILYNVPSNTGIDLSPAAIVQLARHRNIIGLKDSSGNIAKMTRVVHESRQSDFQVLAGSASFLLPALQAGCVGGVCAAANVLGNELLRLRRLALADERRDALHLQARLIAPNNAVSADVAARAYAAVEVTREMGVPALKHMLDLYGYFGGAPRSPLQPLSPADRQRVEAVFRGNGFAARD